MSGEPVLPDMSAALNAIWSKHRALMFNRLDVIDTAIAAAARDALDTDTREAAHRDAHKLAGALGTFGLDKGTAYARTIEDALAEDGVINVSELKEAARQLREQIASRA